MNKFQPKEGDAVIVKTNNKNRGTWPLAIVNRTFPGKDGIVRGVELKTVTGFIERPVQLVYPLELDCDINATGKQTSMNPNAPEFLPKRGAAVAADLRIKEIQQSEDS